MSGHEELTRHDDAWLAETGEEAQTTINSAGIKATRADDVGVAWVERYSGIKAPRQQSDKPLMRALKTMSHCYGRLVPSHRFRLQGNTIF